MTFKHKRTLYKVEYSYNKISLSPGDIVEVIRWWGGRFKPQWYYIQLRVVGIDYKNPRGRIKMTTLGGRKEYLIYPRNIIKKLDNVK